ncbi:DegT/DnrJ/EryC1/StrS family aminotransferase [Avibacterium avium]|uniref:DegT/DnrJ/EryC1/StrS family aminotransferase n=1 Tax=Avibacterium avium TaxID=751 RepID=UPI003BF823C0
MKTALRDITPFDKKIWLSTPTMHGEEIEFVTDAIRTNWVSTVGKNIDALEETVSKYVGLKHSVALASGTSALHMAIKLAGEKINPNAETGNALKGIKVFCSDLTFSASANPILYEGGEPIFIDSERDTWNMDPIALEKAFELYPEVKIVILVHLYGVPAKMEQIVNICRKHNATIIEDAAEALGAIYNGTNTNGYCGAFGDYIAISFNGNKIITGSSGGMLLTNSKDDADKVRKWSTQSRENASWYQHQELGYNYRMSNIIAGIARGNMLHIDEHISQKKNIYERYQQGLKDLPVIMNPYENIALPNYWLSCLLIDDTAMCKQVRDEKNALYISEKGKSCPSEILDILSSFNVEGRPIWKPMHMQPIYRMNKFITANGNDGTQQDVASDIFTRGLCLPSDNKMTEKEQNKIIEIIKRCFS